MSPPGRNVQRLLLLALATATFAANSGALQANIMEARNLTTAREMVEKGNWLVPTMNGELRLEKPPLPTWAAALAMRAFGQDDLARLRLPSALAAHLLLFFLLKLPVELTADALAPFLAAGTAATSFYVFFMARDISWDVFCHAFMLGAIWQLHRGLKGAGGLASFVAAGLLMGLAFLSKGPVPFFSLLLPYLVARAISSGLGPLRAHRWPLLVAFGITLAVSAAWPVYVFLTQPEHTAFVARKESSAWINRNVRPFYQYWSFTAQSGIWAVLATAALVFPYARRRVERFGDYKLLAGWIWAGVLLLSLFPEKKERYLLPVLLPLAILTALLVRALVQAFRDATATRGDRVVLAFHGWLVTLVAAAVPIALWAMVRRNGLAPDPFVTAASLVVFWPLAGVLARATLRTRPLEVWAGSVILVAAACLIVVGQVPRIITRNHAFRPYHELRHRPELTGVPFFRDDQVGSKFIEVVWASGREIRTWDPRVRPELPVAPPLVLVSSEPASAVLGPRLLAAYQIEELGLFDANLGKRWGGDVLRNHVTLIKARRGEAAPAD